MKEQVVPFNFRIRGAFTFDDLEYEEAIQLAKRVSRIESILNRTRDANYDISNLRDMVDALERLASTQIRARASAHSREKKETDDDQT